MERHPLIMFLITLTLSVANISAQNVGINSTGATPNNTAMLDIVSTDKGVLIPRVTLTSTSSNSPVGASVATSLLVYNTATTGDVTPGFYYWTGSNWSRIFAGYAGYNKPITKISLTGNDSHQITVNDGDIVFENTSADTLFLPSASDYPYYELSIAPYDSPTASIRVYATGSDAVATRCDTAADYVKIEKTNGQGTCAYGSVRLKSDGVSKWYVLSTGIGL